MKQVKAYIRCEKAEEVVHALEEAGVSGLTLIDVMAVGPNIDAENYKYSIACVEKYQKVAKIEVVCRDDQAAEFVRVLQRAACTGRQGDGLIYVTDVEKVVKIRNGLEDDAAL